MIEKENKSRKHDKRTDYRKVQMKLGKIKVHRMK